jgi:site-specific recombinase XerD
MEEDYLFQSRVRSSRHLSTRQYARIVHQWVREIGLNSAAYGTHTLRRTKASLIYRRTKNLRAVQLLFMLGRTAYIVTSLPSSGHSAPAATGRSRSADVRSSLS